MCNPNKTALQPYFATLLELEWLKFVTPFLSISESILCRLILAPPVGF